MNMIGLRLEASSALASQSTDAHRNTISSTTLCLYTGPVLALGTTMR